MQDGPNGSNDGVTSGAQAPERGHGLRPSAWEEGTEGPDTDRAPAGAAHPSWVRFDPGHLAVVIADPPGLGELTHAQFELAALRAVEGAAGVEYLDGDAWIRLVLDDPVSADQIARSLQRTFGGTVSVEEAAHAARRLRVRCAPSVAPRRNEQPLRSRLWLRP